MMACGNLLLESGECSYAEPLHFHGFLYAFHTPYMIERRNTIKKKLKRYRLGIKGFNYY